MKKVKAGELRQAVAVLRAGGVAVFPTETSYGLAADATNDQAVRRVLAIKGRRAEHTPPLIAADHKTALRYVELSTKLRVLAREFWPGALTIVAPAKTGAKLAKSVVEKDGTIAIRVSGNATARALAAGSGGPIVATSANVAGEPACFSKTEYDRQMAGRKLREDYFLDAGVLPKRAASTIIKEEKDRVLVLREGNVKLSDKYVA
jgi:L-threonylcarbamoyladenylate synthase